MAIARIKHRKTKNHNKRDLGIILVEKKQVGTNRRSDFHAKKLTNCCDFKSIENILYSLKLEKNASLSYNTLCKISHKTGRVSDLDPPNCQWQICSGKCVIFNSSLL